MLQIALASVTLIWDRTQKIANQGSSHTACAADLQSLVPPEVRTNRMCFKSPIINHIRLSSGQGPQRYFHPTGLRKNLKINFLVVQGKDQISHCITLILDCIISYEMELLCRYIDKCYMENFLVTLCYKML